MIRVIKKIFFYLIIFMLVSLGIFLAGLFKGGRDAAILMYHSVGGPGSKNYPLDISLDSFEKQMAFLHRYHYRVIPLLDLAQLLKDGKKVPRRTVVLTFDDGYENNYTKAYPVLKKYGFPATFFITTDYVGQEKDFLGAHFRFMTPQMLIEMAGSGLVTIGAHTMTHEFLPSVKDESLLWREIRGSKEVLEKILKKPVLAFCYPSGGYTPHIERMVRRAGYQVAVTTLGKNKGFAHRDIFALKRIKPTDAAANPFVFFVETSGYFLRLKELR